MGPWLTKEKGNRGQQLVLDGWCPLHTPAPGLGKGLLLHGGPCPLSPGLALQVWWALGGHPRSPYLWPIKHSTSSVHLYLTQASSTGLCTQITHTTTHRAAGWWGLVHTSLASPPGVGQAALCEGLTVKCWACDPLLRRL